MQLSWMAESLELAWDPRELPVTLTRALLARSPLSPSSARGPAALLVVGRRGERPRGASGPSPKPRLLL